MIGIAGALALQLGVLFGAAGSQKGDCPYCHNSPDILQRAGLVSHGPFPYAATTSEEVEKHLGYLKEQYWLESAHFRFASSLPAYQIPDRDKKKIQAELAELQTLLPAVNPKTMVLDPWLRIHLFAYRAEKFYNWFLDLLGLEESAFQGTRSGKYLGEGRYLGEKGKYEVFLFHAKAPFVDFMRTYTGMEHDRPHRHNFLKTDNLWFGCHTVDDQLNRDLNLYSTLLHNLAQNFLDGYKHYSYDLPVWLTEGFAHFCERMATEEYVSYCFVESVSNFRQNGGGWPQEVRRRLGTGGVPSFADLSRKKSFAEIDETDHFIIWSMVDFMVKSDKKKFAAFLDRMKGRLDDQGLPDARGLTDVQRAAIKEVFGYSYPQFESAWRAYVAKEYSLK